MNALDPITPNLTYLTTLLHTNPHARTNANWRSYAQARMQQARNDITKLARLAAYRPESEPAIHIRGMIAKFESQLDEIQELLEE